MKKNYCQDTIEAAFLALAETFPVAKGSLTKTHSPCMRKGCRLCATGKGHPKIIFTFREGGKLHGLYVRPEHEDLLREALENGRILERLLVSSGKELVMRLRRENDEK